MMDGGVPGDQMQGQQAAEPERQQHRGQRHGDGGAPLSPHRVVVESHPDQEHEQRQPDVGQRAEVRADGLWDQGGADDPVKEERSDEYPGADLTDYRGLPKAPRQRAQQLGEDQDEREREKQWCDFNRGHGSHSRVVGQIGAPTRFSLLGQRIPGGLLNGRASASRIPAGR